MMNQTPPLGRHDVRQLERAHHQDDAHHRDEQRNFVGHVLGHGADSPEDRVLVVGGPAGHEDGQDRQGGEAEDQHDPHVHVPDDQGLGEGDHQEGEQHRQEDDDGGQPEDRLIRFFRGDELLAHELEGVGHGLEAPCGPTSMGPRRTCIWAETLRSTQMRNKAFTETRVMTPIRPMSSRTSALPK